MGLNIKNPRVHALARQAAEVTGKTQTSAIEEALMKLLESHGISADDTERRHRIDAVTSLLARIDIEVARTPAGDVGRVEDLYDEETGLPR